MRENEESVMVHLDGFVIKILVGLIVIIFSLSGYIANGFYQTINELKAENSLYDQELSNIKVHLMHITDKLEDLREKHYPNDWNDEQKRIIKLPDLSKG